MLDWEVPEHVGVFCVNPTSLVQVTGSYSYSDGFYRRTVNYEADENGYRVVS